MTAVPHKKLPSRGPVVLALIAVYLIWGSTYLGLRFGLEGFPPFLLNGFRFLMAGGALALFLLARGKLKATRAQMWNAARVGTVMLVGGVGLVTLSQNLGIGSGVAATAVAVIPVWAAVVGGLFGDWPRRRELLGLGLGLAGVLILALEGDFRSSPAGLALIVIAPILWSFGSVWGTRLDLPDPLASTSIQLCTAGLVMTAVGFLIGEKIVSPPSATSWIALAYLTVMGSLVAFTAFVYLMNTVRPALATSYAYVNPIVAVALGLSLGNETITGAILLALPLILAAVALVARSARTGRQPRMVKDRGVPRVQEEAA
jgi:drug/metabolite transporter (DMT)-like permease